jgi:hypothetical protein
MTAARRHAEQPELPAVVGFQQMPRRIVGLLPADLASLAVWRRDVGADMGPAGHSRQQLCDAETLKFAQAVAGG